MKEASGEASNTVITIILIAALLAAAGIIVASVNNAIKTKTGSLGNSTVDVNPGSSGAVSTK